MTSVTSRSTSVTLLMTELKTLKTFEVILFRPNFHKYWILLVTLSILITGVHPRPTVPRVPARPTVYLDISMNNATCTVLLYGDVTSRPHVHKSDYDHKGAMFFAVAVISLYGISIALLIGSTLRRDDGDYELKGFLRSFAKVDMNSRKHEKYRIKQVLQKANFIFHPPMERKMYLASLQNFSKARRSSSNTPGATSSAKTIDESVKTQLQTDDAMSGPSGTSPPIISGGEAVADVVCARMSSPETSCRSASIDSSVIVPPPPPPPASAKVYATASATASCDADDVHAAIVHTIYPASSAHHGEGQTESSFISDKRKTFVTIPQAEHSNSLFKPINNRPNRVIIRVPAVCHPKARLPSFRSKTPDNNPFLSAPQATDHPLSPILELTKLKFKLPSPGGAVASTSVTEMTPLRTPRSQSAYDLRGTFRQTAC